MTYEFLKEQLLEAGVVGSGGAGFPTHIKLAKDMDYLIVNGAECEPLLYTDYQLLKHYGGEIIDLLNEVLIACHIGQGIIALKKKHKELIDELGDYARKYPNICIKAVENVYPVGDEITLIYECTGRVVPRGQLPSSQKVVEVNVETLLNLRNKVKFDQAVTHTYLTIGGSIDKPQVVRAPLGIKVKDLFKRLEIELPEDASILMGGPMMGNFGSLETILTKTTKSILVIPKGHILHTFKQNADINTVKRAMSSCSQCRMCTDLCPRNRLGHKVEPHKVMNAFANGLLNHCQGIETALGCCGCNICSYFACHHDLAPGTLMMAIKQVMLANGERGKEDPSPVPKDERTPRIPSSRLLSRLGLTQYDKKAEWNEDEIVPNFVYIPISQHIGKKAEIVVKMGDEVQVGMLIARNSKEGLSTNIHASVNGKVVCLDNDMIMIESYKR